MILTDTGPLVALLNADDQHHSQCVDAARRLPPVPLLTTWVCFTEAMYLLGSIGGYHYQVPLWNLRAEARLVLHEMTPTEADRMAALMSQYRDTPIALADASLIAVPESRSIRSLFTVDGDFYIYRLLDGPALDILR